MLVRTSRNAGIVAVVALCASLAAAHAVPQRFEPRQGATVSSMPREVRIVFDGDLEPAFSTIQVTDSAGGRADMDDARVDKTNRRVLRVGLRTKEPGLYRVSWRILAIDGHRSEGTYTFTVAAATGGR